MDKIEEALVEAGYFRARISTLSDFDKIIGGMAWAMQVFSYDINIDIFYKETLDLGSKIALTERLVMVCLVMNCPHQIEPHQLIGLDYANILPVLKWLIKRSFEIRQEHEAFNRLLALRHYHRVTNTIPKRTGSKYSIVPLDHLKKLRRSSFIDDEQNSNFMTRESDRDKEMKAAVAKTSLLLSSISEEFKTNKHVSFVKLPTLFKVANSSDLGKRSSADSEEEEEEEAVEVLNEANLEVGRHKSELNQEFLEAEVVLDSNLEAAELDDSNLRKELNNELLATNQKILNLLRKLDSMPSQLEISQYQRRYIELHQQLIGRNRDIKKLYALYNSLDSTKHYLTKEINLLDSILSNLDLTNNSSANRDSFIKQFQDIIQKIQNVRDEVVAKLVVIRKKCDTLNAEYAVILNQQ